jgi:hypothetical protein
MREIYKKQAKLMLQILSAISDDQDNFALKGDTAINFF